MTERPGTDWDVGMTTPALSDNLDQGRLDSRGFIGGRSAGSSKIDRSRRNEYRTPQEASIRDFHQVKDMLGMDVVGPQGEHPGTIHDFVPDDMGRIDFVLVRTDTKDIAVPFAALSLRFFYSD